MILAEKLLASLNPPIQAEIDRLWGEEVERRVARIAVAHYEECLSGLGIQFAEQRHGAAAAERAAYIDR